MLSRKGQISLFIILGVIVIIIGVFYISLNDDPFFLENSPTYKVVSNIKDSMESCLNTQVNNGFKKLGLTGGWIYTPFPLIYAKSGDPDAIIEISQGFEDIGGVKRPYWEYYDEDSDSFVVNIPSFDDKDDDYSIRSQLERYVYENVRNICINNLKSFSDEAEINFDYDSFEINVNFDGEEYDVSMILPIEINHINTDKVDYLDSFDVSGENPIYVSYFLARDIANSQINTAFLEENIFSFMEVYMDSESRDFLPPSYDIKLDLDYKPWLISDVKEFFKRMLESNIIYVHLLETADEGFNNLPEPLLNNELANGVFRTHSKYYLGGENLFNSKEDYSLVRKRSDRESKRIFNRYSDFSAITTFSQLFPFRFGVQQALGGEVLMPDTKLLLPFPIQLGTTIYKASYYFSGPVVFRIFEKDGNGYEFWLPLEVNIVNNKPLKKQPSYAKDLGLVGIENIGSNYKGDLICDPSQFVSKPVNVSIFDPIGGGSLNKGERTGIEDVLVSFSCRSTLPSCFLGTTKIVGGYTNLSIRLPDNCEPLSLSFSKFGYKNFVINDISPSFERGINLGEYSMPSKKKFKLKTGFFFYSSSKPSTYFTNLVRFNDKQKGIIIFKDLSDETNVEVVEVNSKNQDNLTISLLPSNYSIEAFVISEDKDNKIKEAVIKVDDAEFLGITVVDNEDIVLPEINLTSWVSGRYKLENFEVSLDDVYENDFLVLPIIDFGFPSSYDSLRRNSNFDKIKSYSLRFSPKFCDDEEVTRRAC